MKASITMFASIVLIVISDLTLANETIVFIRHGEKPSQGLGQLRCQGLSRAMKLPVVLHGFFGKPTAVFAPNPGMRKKDKGVPYNYVRPLATIEPTAVLDGLPVNTDYEYKEIGALQKALLAPHYTNATVFVAWEHDYAVQAARALMRQFASDPKLVPDWDDKDFDSIYVVRIRIQANGSRTASFEHKQENLNNLPDICPAG